MIQAKIVIFILLLILQLDVFCQTVNMDKAFLGIGLEDSTDKYRQLQKQLHGQTDNQGAIRINRILVDSPADKYGLITGDILYSINNNKLDVLDPVKSFKSILAQYLAGEKVTLNGFRYTNNQHIEKIEKKIILSSWRDRPKLKEPPPPVSKKLLQQIALQQSSFSDNKILKQTNDEVFQAKLKSDAMENIPGSNELEFYLHNNPQMLLGTALSIQQMAIKHQDKLAEKLLLDFYKPEQTPITAKPVSTMNSEEFITHLKQLLIEIQSQNKTLDSFYTSYRTPLDRLKSYYQDKESSTDPEFHQQLNEISKISQKHQILSNQLIIKLSQFFNKKLIKQLPDLFKKDKLPKYIEFNNMTIIISGLDNDNHYQGADVIIDLGGNDNYFVADKSKSKPIIIDLSGNDIYQSMVDFQWGSVEHGIAYLLDVGGNDHYISRDFSMGSAFIGAALLEDRDGNDSYYASRLSMGVGLLGSGIVSDYSGNDTYLSGSLSQAAGLFMGQGYLIDKSGNDRYISTAQQPDSWQQKDGFDGLSMGIGLGLRDIARGGIGILFDFQGDDDYHSGNFSLGCAYYFAIGGLIDLQGNDSYQAMRYGIGSAAHSASAFFIDNNGSDSYKSTQQAIAGAAWDLSSTVFIDAQGDDYYHSSGLFSFAAADNNSLAIHLDKKGNDTYQNGFFTKQKNNYHNGKSFGIFINSTGQDSYPNSLQNNQSKQINQFYFSDK